MKLHDVKNQLGIADMKKIGFELSRDQKWYSRFLGPVNLRIFLAKDVHDKIKEDNADVTYTKKPRLSKKGREYQEIQIHLASGQEFDSYL